MFRIFGRRLTRIFSRGKADPWLVLGVQRNATEKDIKKAYLQSVKVHHPDISKDNGEQFKKIQEAYSILCDPQKKREYFSSQSQSHPNEGDPSYSNPGPYSSDYYSTTTTQSGSYQEAYRRAQEEFLRQERAYSSFYTRSTSPPPPPPPYTYTFYSSSSSWSSNPRYRTYTYKARVSAPPPPYTGGFYSAPSPSDPGADARSGSPLQSLLIAALFLAFWVLAAQSHKDNLQQTHNPDMPYVVVFDEGDGKWKRGYATRNQQHELHDPNLPYRKKYSGFGGYAPGGNSANN